LIPSTAFRCYSLCETPFSPPLEPLQAPPFQHSFFRYVSFFVTFFSNHETHFPSTNVIRRRPDSFHPPFFFAPLRSNVRSPPQRSRQLFLTGGCDLNRHGSACCVPYARNSLSHFPFSEHIPAHHAFCCTRRDPRAVARSALVFFLFSVSPAGGGGSFPPQHFSLVNPPFPLLMKACPFFEWILNSNDKAVVSQGGERPFQNLLLMPS